MTRRRIVVVGFDPERAHITARRLRDEGAEVVLLGEDADVETVGRAVVAEDASEVVVAGQDEADRVRAWLDEQGAEAVSVHVMPA